MVVILKKKKKIHLSEDFEININNLDSKPLNTLFTFIKKIICNIIIIYIVINT